MCGDVAPITDFGYRASLNVQPSVLMRKVSLSLLLLASLLLAPRAWTAVAADPDSIHPMLQDNFTFRAGALRNKADARFIASSPLLPETEVDMGTLGLNQTKTTGWLAFRWRFSQRWALNFSYNAFAVEGGRNITRPFNFDGIEFEAGTDIDTSLRADAWVADVSYSFYKSRNLEMGAGLGIHAFDMKTEIDSIVFVGDKIQRQKSSKTTLIAPVPNLRLFSRLALSNRSALALESGLLSLNYDDWSGSFFYASGRMEYRFKNRVGAGIGYQLTDMNLEESRRFGGRRVYDIKFSGATFYLTYSY